MSRAGSAKDMVSRGVIFDLNGTLLWDTGLHNAAWDHFVERHGLALTDLEKSRRIHGKANQEILRGLFDEPLDAATIETYIHEKESVYQELFRASGIGFAPGVTELLTDLRTRGIPYALATSSGPENIAFYADAVDLDRWFVRAHVIHNDGTLKSKPDPDMYLRAMKTLGCAPEACTVFEDSPVGITAAERSGAGRIVVVSASPQDWVDQLPTARRASVDAPVSILRRVWTDEPAHASFAGHHTVIRRFTDVDPRWFGR